MIDSSNITLNIAALPVNKKKAKRKPDVAVNPTPISYPKPKLVQITPKPIVKHVKSNPVGILKPPTVTSTQSIWKKFKQSYKKGNNAKSDFFKPINTAAKTLEAGVKAHQGREIINPKKSVSFDSDKPVSDRSVGDSSKFNSKKKNSFNSLSSGLKSDIKPDFVKPTIKATKVIKKRVKGLEKPDSSKSNNTVSFDDDGTETENSNKLNTLNFNKRKAFTFLDSDTQSKIKPKKKKLKVDEGNYSGDKGQTEKKSGKTTSLFWNNPEIPEIPHRAVKPAKELVFSNVSFKDLNLHPFMVKNLEESMGLTKATTVQEKSIPILLAKQDALIRSQTGSGKTLAYALPILHDLQGIRPKISRSDGVMVLIVVPTRELAMQTYEVFNKLVKSYTWVVPGYLVGGEKRKSEKARLRKGISILIGTPGRLIDHIQHTKALTLDKVSWLVIDEADRLLDMGYERDVSILLETLNKDDTKLLKPNYLLEKTPTPPKEKDEPKNRQTILLSATLTQKVEKLAGLSLKNPVFVDACDENVTSSTHVPVFSNDLGTEVDTIVLPESLVQKYTVTPPKLKLVTLTSFILWKSKLTKEKKMLIFLATQDMVDYYTQLLSSVFSSSKGVEEESDEEDSHFSNSGIELFKLHGNMKQNERTEVFKTFRKSHLGVLLCTDVASRGLDLPEVDWVIQYTGPTSVSDYVHRVGRTARGGQSGSSIIFLTPNEINFIGKLENCQIRLQEQKMETCLNHLLSLNPRGRSVQEEATNLQTAFENLVSNNSKLYDMACKAFASWSRFYSSYPRNMRDVFNVKTVHQGHYAKSFALKDTPSAIVNYAKKKNLNEERTVRKRPRERKETEKKKGLFGKSRLAEISEFDSGLEPVRKKKK